MEAVDERARSSALHSLINRDYQSPSSSRDPPERAYPPATSMATSAVISPVTMYPTHPSHPYPHLSTASSTSNLSGLISPPDSYGADSRRTSDDTKDPAPQRQSLPSIQEALLRPSGYPSGPPPPPPPPPLSTAQPSYPPTYSQPPPPTPTARSYAGDAGAYPGPSTQPPSQRNSPPQPVHPPSVFSGLNPPYAEQSRQPSLPSLRTTLPPQPSPYPPAHPEQPRYDPDPRSADRPGPPDAYSHARLQDDRYAGYPPVQAGGPPPGFPPRSPFSAPRPFPPRIDKESNEVHLKNGEPEQPFVFNKALKRGLSNHDLEMALAELNDCSYQISKISTGILTTVQRYQRSEPGLPSVLMQGVPTMRDFDSILEYRRRLDNAIQNVKACMDEQQYVLEDQHSRNQNGKAEYGEDTWNSDKDQGFGPDAKKRRGRAAPPGRCHSCNRAETPEWRRGPDGARTLCNACGLHYAKLTRRMGSKLAQNAASSSLRPKSLEDTSPRP